jgi:asparagine synthase (glutamine-hydrolysing)
MCGFVGILAGAPDDGDARQLRRRRTQDALHAIRHRGPDDQQFFHDQQLSLGFARLAIVDLECGTQPMTNETGTLWLVFNGEIYNHLALRRELVGRGHRFKTDHSDTEVLLHGWEEWGEGLLPRLNGMFAFLLWDQQARALVAARDRFGVKPLYYARAGDGWLFASEIKAILASGLVVAERDNQAVGEYVLHQNTWGERTFFKGIQEFPKATVMRIQPGGATSRRVYWSPVHRRDAKLRYEEAVLQHRHLLAQAVHAQMMADVPVMSYLSGGIDSSALTALAARSRSDVSAYACLFELAQVGEDRFVDEREFSRAAAQHLGLPLNELELSPLSLVKALDGTIRALETPRMGMAYVNYLIAQRVARDGKVVLSGTGGDEYHGGYVGRYAYVADAPAPVPAGPRSPLRAAARWLRQLGAGGSSANAGDLPWKSRVATLLNYPVPWAELEQALDPAFLRSVDFDLLAEEQFLRLRQVEELGPVPAMLALDSDNYLHGLLVMEDKLSMAHSLEARVPLLDNDLVDFTLTMPIDFLYRGGVGKSIFRDSVAPLLPEVVTRKPKMGFGPPDASWYRGPLRSFLEERLASAELASAGVFRPEYLRRKLDGHLAGHENNVPLLWSALSLQSWHLNFCSATREGPDQ